MPDELADLKAVVRDGLAVIGQQAEALAQAEIVVGRFLAENTAYRVLLRELADWLTDRDRCPGCITETAVMVARIEAALRGAQ